MADERKQESKNEKPMDGNEQIHGRIYNSQNPKYEQKDAQADISGVDQQEGDMNHGETGANLGPQTGE